MRLPSDTNVLIRSLTYALVLLFVLALAAPGGAQPSSADGSDLLEQPRPRTVVKKLDFLDVRAVPQLLAMLEVQVVVDDRNQAVILRGHDELDTALGLLDALDDPPTPSPNLELVVTLLGVETGGSLADLPEDLKPVAEQLGRQLGLDGFQLLDTTILRIRDGSQGQVEGIFTSSSGKATHYRLEIGRARRVGLARSQLAGAREIPEGTVSKFRLDGLEFSLDGHGPQLATDIDLRAGQKAVIGKAANPGAGGSLILVLDARVLD